MENIFEFIFNYSAITFPLIAFIAIAIPALIFGNFHNKTKDEEVRRHATLEDHPDASNYFITVPTGEIRKIPIAPNVARKQFLIKAAVAALILGWMIAYAVYIFFPNQKVR
jgi:hypothetical protein